METVLTFDPIEAAEHVKRGGIVAFPTETVYGLGANVFDAEAVAKIFEAKMRPSDNPLIAHIAEREQVFDLGQEFTLNAGRLIGRFFPGPLTIVVKRTDRVPDIATAGLDTIGIRMPRYDLAHRFLVACGVPIVAPSANLSGRPSPTTWQAVYEDLNGRIDCILMGEPTEIGIESTVVDCTSEPPVLLRLGSISLEQLQAAVPAVQAPGPGGGERPRSPGLRHKHYSPRANVIMIVEPGDAAHGSAESRSAFIGLRATGRRLAMERVCETVDEYAREVFEFFRECDRQGIEKIFCQTVPDRWVGAALMDRLRRAAED